VTLTHRRLAAAAIVAGLVCAGTPALATPAFAAQPTAARSTVAQSSLDQLTRAAEVRFAENHWNWTAWNDRTPVAAGGDQPDYQCAEFVARAMAAARLIPGLSPNAPQDDYFHYTAPNGKIYDLLLISDLPQYHNLYDYLMDSGVGTDVGDDPVAAQPGDIVVTYAGPGGTKSHTGLVVQAATGGAEATVDAHNHARFHFGYHYYAPSHLVRLVPDALLEVWTWATEEWANGTPKPSPSTPHQLLQTPGTTDPAGPQV
jgi:hypothetical protein